LPEDEPLVIKGASVPDWLKAATAADSAFAAVVVKVALGEEGVLYDVR